MAPTAFSLVSRYYNGNCDVVDEFGNCYYGSSWDRWGRWVALVVVVLFIILIAFVFSCMNARRRRNRGMAPRYGTGWLGGKTESGPRYYNNGQQLYPTQNPAPPYSPQPQREQFTGNTFNSNEGYYGQQSGVELQQPKYSYQPQRGGEPVYEPPQGPPNGKGGYNDGIIR